MRSLAPRLAPFAAAVFGVAARALVACAEEPASPPSTMPTPREDQAENLDGGAAGTSDATTVDRPQSKQYLAFLKTGPCQDVSATTGRWRSQALFPDAPLAVREIACAYTWTSTEAPDVPDRDALVAGIGAADLVTQSAAPIPIDLPAVDPREAEPIDGGLFGDGPPTGVSGCDVCGRIAGQRIFVIRPPEKVSYRRLLVPTTTGMVRVFDIPAEASAQVFTVRLPATPSGDAYTDGRAILVPTP